SVFFHPGAPSFCMTMLFLWLFGDNVEDQTGRGRFAILYLLCSVSATLAQSLIDPGSSRSLIGASGAISGVMGAYFVLYPRSRILIFFPLPLTLHELPAAFFLGLWFLLQFVTVVAHVGVEPRAADVAPALAAHAVGFAAGALLCLVLRRHERARVEWWSP
ncbi:MAG: rhomboid family intramembrane serine protease, partial [Vicinamibacterales bacterium]